MASGTGFFRILWRHILPNTLRAAPGAGHLHRASAMITEAILSLLGAGTPPNIPSWGNIMAEGRSLFQIAYLHRPVPRHLPVAHRARDQPARRRAARRARPAPGAAHVAHARGCLRRYRPEGPGRSGRADPRHRRSADLVLHPRRGRARGRRRLVSRHPRARRWRSSARAAAARASPRSRSCGWSRRRPAASSPARSASPGATCSASAKPRCAQVRGNEISMIFQEPMTSLNPVLTIGAADRRDADPAPGARPQGGARQGRRDAAPRAHPRGRARASANTRTSCRAACGSG